jgi:hypothetical protein
LHNHISTMNHTVHFFKPVFAGHHPEHKALDELKDKEHCFLCDKPGVVKYTLSQGTQTPFCDDHIMLKEPRTRFSSPTMSLFDYTFLQIFYNSMLFHFYKKYHIHAWITRREPPIDMPQILFDFTDCFFCPVDFEHVVQLTNLFFENFKEDFNSNRLVCLLFAFVHYFCYSKLDATSHPSINNGKLWDVCFNGLYDFFLENGNNPALEQFNFACKLSNDMASIVNMLIRISSSQTVAKLFISFRED